MEGRWLLLIAIAPAARRRPSPTGKWFSLPEAEAGTGTASLHFTSP
jgi:hypothetical protein